MEAAPEGGVFSLVAAPADAGLRLDRFLCARLPSYSRARLQQWIKQERVTIWGRPAKPSYVLRGNEKVTVDPLGLPPLKATPEDIPLEVLYEDEHVIAIDKPAGMVVHVGAGRRSGTLVNALLHRFEQLSQIGGEMRPGIVHRLDKDTSGVILVARNDAAHRALAQQFAGREVEKVYLALVHGVLRPGQGTITKPIGRDVVHRTRMSVTAPRGRSAITHYRSLEHSAKFSFVELRIGTGRTHQIRVHLASLGHPVVGDRLYGASARFEGQRVPERFFLHAHRITFQHPVAGTSLSITSPLPPDLEAWKRRLL